MVISAKNTGQRHKISSFMKNISAEQIFDALKELVNPESISGLDINKKGDILFALRVDPAMGAEMEELRQQVEQAVLSIKGVKKVTVILTAEKTTQAPETTSDPHGMGKNPILDLPIRKIIAVASGKGGVGKSTVAVNLAYALGKSGKSVGLLDADIYGPSVPRLTALPNIKPETNQENKLVPFEEHGFKVMSIGFMVDQNTPMIWRGPMVQSAIYQMLRDVAWGTEESPLDILIVDMPPGTGDAQLTLAQKINLDGAVMVSTPQDLALLDVRKGIEMFKKMNVPILGLIENMSTHICANCGHEEHLFGHGGARVEAAKLHIPFLGEVPLDITIRQSADQGKLKDFKVFDVIAEKLNL